MLIQVLVDHRLQPLEVVVREEEEVEEVVIEEEAVIEEEVDKDHKLEEEVVKDLQDSMLTAKQLRRKSTDHTEESHKVMVQPNMIDNPVPEEEESLMIKRADTEDSMMETSRKLYTSKRVKLMERLLKKPKKRRFTRNQNQSQSQKWSNSLSPSMRSKLARPHLVRKKLENLKVLRDRKFKKVEKKKNNPLFSKTHMLRTPLQELLMPTTSTLVSEPQ